MIEYDFPLFRPPSEADSLIFQITTGCSHNRCTFCYMYKMKRFSIRSLEVVKREIFESSIYYPFTKRVFLADGNALVCKTSYLLEICDYLNERFPLLERISLYANPQDILRKSEEELKLLNSRKLTLLYIGLESGDDEILSAVQKGVNSSQIIESVIKAKKCGFKTSITAILGLGGKERTKNHAMNTARVVTRMNPHYLGILTLMLGPMEKFFSELSFNGKWTPLSPEEMLEELYIMIENINGRGIVFRSNHASNYLPLKGVLSEDKDKLLSLLRHALENPSLHLRPEYLRAL